MLLTLGNAKSIDLVAITENDKSYHVQVKTLRKGPNCFDLYSPKIKDEHVYIFMYLNEIGQQPDYFILKGETLKGDLSHFYGSSLGRVDKRETVNYGPLVKHRNDWSIFEH